ncbi:MAG: hypothetical protein ACOCRX_05600, partial [Candidatus Woesearchaeota archaeon]
MGELVPYKEYVKLNVGEEGCILDGVKYSEGVYYLHIPNKGVKVEGDYNYEHVDHLILGQYNKELIYDNETIVDEITMPSSDVNVVNDVIIKNKEEDPIYSQI